MKPSSKRILGLLLIVLSVLALPLAFCQYWSQGFSTIPCGRPQDISADTRIAYCIGLLPWAHPLLYASQLYAEGMTNQDEIQVRDLHFRREEHILWVDNHPVHPNDTYQTIRLHASLNPWLILTRRFEITNEDRMPIRSYFYSSAPSNTNVLFIYGEVHEGTLPNPLGLIILCSGILLFIQGKRTKI